MMKFNFPYHLVSLSPWPIMSSLGVMYNMLGVLKVFYNLQFGLMIYSNLFLLLILFQWWRDVVRESHFQGMHNLIVMKGLRLGMILFILSELMFFVSFFWTYFHLFLSPSIELGSKSPSFSLEVFNPYNIPLLNTLILLSSGVSITWCHHSLMKGKYNSSLVSIMLTVMLGFIFTYFQYIEYKESYFTMSDSMYGSIFFLATGFHGLHVLIGSMFILVNLIRIYNKQVSLFHHLGFEACSWYWHFVDVVWLFLYIFIYWLSY